MIRKPLSGLASTVRMPAAAAHVHTAAAVREWTLQCTDKENKSAHRQTDRQAENASALLRTVFHAVHIGYVAAVLREHLNNDRIKIPRSVAHVPRPP